MDNKKDNSDVKGQQKEAVVNNSLVNLFDVDSIIKKTQKISTATYLLTEHIEVSDPVRGRTRECAIIILKDIYASSHGSAHKDKRDRLTRLVQMIEEMIVLFEIMLLAKMVSENNHAIMRQELVSLKEMTLKGGMALDSHIVFPEKLFEELEISLKKRDNILIGEEGGIHKGQNDNVLYGRSSRSSVGHAMSDKGGPSENKGNRRLHILKLIRKNKDLGIKNIYNSFTGVSEKTIQRELTKMVNDKVIVRKGDKRWSRYSLA